MKAGNRKKSAGAIELELSTGILSFDCSHALNSRGRNPGISGSRDPRIQANLEVFGIPGLEGQDPGIRRNNLI